MTDERIAQLRKAAKLIRGTECDGWGALLLEALTEIDRLRAALAEREAAYRDLAAEHEARMAESDATIAQLRAEWDKTDAALVAAVGRVEELREALIETDRLHGLRMCEACDLDRTGVDCTCLTPAIAVLRSTDWREPAPDARKVARVARVNVDSSVIGSGETISEPAPDAAKDKPCPDCGRYADQGHSTYCLAESDAAKGER